MSLSLRAATPADEPFLLGLTQRLADFPLPPWRTARQISQADHAILLQALNRPTEATLLLLAEEDERPVGGIFVATRSDYFTGLPQAHVEVLAVVPDRVGHGVGRRLLEGAEEWARRRGYRQISLNVFATNAPARRLYDRAGYDQEIVQYRKALDGDA